MRLLILIVLSAVPGLLYACNVCGGSSNSQNLGVLPGYDRHFAGLQYLHKSYRGGTNEDRAEEPAVTDVYRSVQLWGRYTLNDRIQLFGFLPYSYNTTDHDEGPVSINGLGDLSLIANYRLIRSDACGPLWKNNLQLGGGVKLPTGGHDPGQLHELLQNMQPGTGSWDFIANLNYSAQYQDAGISVDANYALTTPNQDDYKFGNRLAVSVAGYYTISSGNYSVLPVAGLRIENYQQDFDSYGKRWVNTMTGGHVLFATLGVHAFYARIGFSITAGLPVYQAYPENRVSAGYKAESGIQVLF